MSESEPWVGSWRPHKPKGPISAQFRSPGPIYELPPITGSFLHESTKRNAPAFTMGARPRERPCSPGLKFTLPSTEKNNESQLGTHGITFGRRLPPQKLSQGPGPGTYYPELSEHITFPRVCAFPLTGKTKEKEKDDNPGPATYNLFEKIYSTIPMAPACTLKGRTKAGDFYGYANQNPSPAEYNAVNSDTFQNKAPQYSFQGRNFLPVDKTKRPGPAEYHLKEECMKRRAPSFSFGVRHSEYISPVLLSSEE